MGIRHCTGFSTLMLSAGILLQPVFAHAESSSVGVCKIADSTIPEISEIRKLKIKKSVPCEVHNRDQVRDYILTQISKKIPAEKLRAEETIYKSLGFIPEDFDYQKGIVELYTSQIGGYYDPEQQHFVMAGWMPEMMQTTIAAHELTHALQDQYFDLSKFMDDSKLTSDQILARSALVEGDATAAMMDFQRALIGQKSIATEDNVRSMMMQNVMGAAMMNSLGGVPQSLQSLLIFPYTSGLRFAHEQLRKGGYGEIDKVFRAPPRSTEEILHPEKYGKAKEDFVIFTDEDMRNADVPSGYVASHSDTLGEFGISALMAGFYDDKSKAADIAAGWGGDRVVIYSAGTDTILIWRSAWDTPSDATEFFAGLKQIFSKRYPGKSIEGDTWHELAKGFAIKVQTQGNQVSASIRR